MGQTIKVFRDSSLLEYDKGNFDDWCIYFTRPLIAKYAPKDIQYFARFQELGQIHTNAKIYNYYVQVFDRTTKIFDPSVLSWISELTASYGNDSLEMDILFSIVYAGMVAEENKVFTRLGKRIKRLGMYNILIENKPPYDAANFSKGKGWREIDFVCRQGGF